MSTAPVCLESVPLRSSTQHDLFLACVDAVPSAHNCVLFCQPERDGITLNHRRVYLRERPEGDRSEPESHKILLFIKAYDPVAVSLTYVGSVAVDEDSPLADALPYARRLAGIPQDRPVIFLEEQKNT